MAMVYQIKDLPVELVVFLIWQLNKGKVQAPWDEEKKRITGGCIYTDANLEDLNMPAGWFSKDGEIRRGDSGPIIVVFPTSKYHQHCEK